MTPITRSCRKIVNSKSLPELNDSIKDAVVNYEPATDESPYFFNMLRLDHLGFAFNTEAGVLKGNLIATVTLVGLILCLAILAIVTIIVPLRIGTRAKGTDAASKKDDASRRGLFLPDRCGFYVRRDRDDTEALGLPWTSGLRAWDFAVHHHRKHRYRQLPERSTAVDTTAADSSLLPVLTAVVIVLQKFVLSALVAGMITEPIGTKALVCVIAIFPLGILLGCLFSDRNEDLQTARRGRHAVVLGAERDLWRPELGSRGFCLDLFRDLGELLYRRRFATWRS